MAKKKAPEPTVSHVKAAENIISSKTDVPVPTNVFMAAMATAQVHATLALAEQQRIANLQVEREESAKRYERSGNSYEASADEFTLFDREIREALGLS